VRLILVRHGDAHAGFQGVVGGQTGCTGLTAQGRAQAEALRDHLADSGRVRADVLLASVLPRAIETASIIAPGLGLEISGQECDLCELHPGEADGLTWTDYAARYGSFDLEAEPDRVFAPAGESWNSFHERVRRTLERVARDYEGQTVVAVCHAGVIMASMRVLLGIPPLGTGARLRPTNTGLTDWEHDPSLARWTRQPPGRGPPTSRQGPRLGGHRVRGPRRARRLRRVQPGVIAQGTPKGPRPGAAVRDSARHDRRRPERVPKRPVGGPGRAPITR
jgi:broad specificity phosphatase PhoE